MKGRIKSAMSMVLAIALLLTTMISTSMFSGLQAKAESVTTVVADDGTRNIDFNDDWQFFLATRTPSLAGGSGGSGFAANGLADAGGVTTAQVISKTFDDSAWRTLSVPHDFAIEGPKLASGSAGSSQGYMQGGLGWYRKTFVLPKSFEGSQKRFIIDFEGVYQNSDVYLNGELVGNYPSGYTGFAYDITDKVTFGEDEPNVLVVKVQAMAASGRWYTGAGIFRPVHLVVTHPVRFVREGVKLTTPNVETEFKADGSANLKVEARVYSDASNGVMRMRTSVLDKAGTVVATKTTQDPLDINPSTLGTIDDTINVPAVNLWYPWDLGEPYLYTVKTELLYEQNGGTGEQLVDTVETKFGFRWFHFDSYDASNVNQGGLYINDKYTKINGVDLHHDSGALGAASLKDAYERQFTILKSMGVNSYRTSHCPPSKQVIEVCSELGFFVMEEAYDGWGTAKATYDFGNFFFTNVPENWPGLAPNGLTSATLRPGVDYAGVGYVWSDWVTRQMVMRDINEASVLMWSIGNEVRGVGTRPSWYDGTKYSDRSELTGTGTTATTINEFTEAVRLAEDIKQVDTSRRIAMGGDQQRTAAAVESTWGRVNRYLGGYGLNYNTAASIDTLMSRFPNTFFFESESSSQTSARGKYQTAHIKNSGVNQTPGGRGGSGYDNDFASWTMSNEYGLKKDRDNKAFTGQYIWSGFDYIGEPTPYSVFPVGVSSFGTIDTAGFPKDSYYLFRSQWINKADEAMVHIVPSNWNDWREGEMVEVWVNSNVQTVELFQDGVSLGTKSFDIKKTNYGKEYYETSELNPDDKTWPSTGLNAGNPSGYVSTNATIVSASGDSAIPEGSKFGKLHLTWKVPFKKGSLTAKAYTSPAKTQLVAEDKLVTAGAAYTVKLEANKEVIKADGRSLTYVEATVVDKDGNVVPGADNLLKFDVTGGAIVGVDNGQQENAELYKWGNVERNSHSERTAFSGKALVILQSNKGEVGTMKLNVTSDGLATAVKNIAVTVDGKGTAPAPVPVNPTAVSIRATNVATRAGFIPTLPAYVYVNYIDASAGFYTVKKPVVWNAVTFPQITVVSDDPIVVEGTVDGVTQKAIANVFVAIKDKTDVARNTALGANNATFDFSTLPDNSTLRNGALATATYTSGTSLYPNNMVNGATANLWNNIGTRAASVLLPLYNWARPDDTVTFYWDSERQVDQVDMEFNIAGSGQYVVPTTLNVQYWNGGEWVNAKNQVVTKATSDYGTTSITFGMVNTEKVRVEMYSATANSDASSAANVRGAIQIRNVSIMGYNFNDLLPEPDTSVQGVTISKTSASMHIEDEITLLASVIPAEATNKAITWSSSDSTIASVADGKVTALKAGTVTITAAAVEGEGTFKANCVITVVPNVTFTVNTGETVLVPITAENVTKLAAFTASLEYDSNLLHFESISAAKGFILVPTGGKFGVMTSNGQGVSGNPVVGYVLFTTKGGMLNDVITSVKFKVTQAKDGAQADTTAIIPMVDVSIIGIPAKRGDINDDGIVDVADAILLMQYIAGNTQLTARQIKAGDINGDGVANVGDSILILQMCLD